MKDSRRSIPGFIPSYFTFRGGVSFFPLVLWGLSIMAAGITAISAAGAQEVRDAPMPQLALAAREENGNGSTRRSDASSGAFRMAHGPCGADAMSSVNALPMSCWPDADPFKKFLNSGLIQPLTPRQKFRLAAKNVADPFNLLTIAGDAAISVGSDSHTRYGPGVSGWAKYSGVSLTQDMTAEFFGTALIPSLARQDPHFHRQPNTSYLRRATHCVTQVVWSQSDTGKPMPNYANLLGIAAVDTISNIYVPGREQGTWPTAARVAVALGSAPIDNFITEFLPDVARHVNIRIVLIQRIINRVALAEPGQ